MRRLSSVGRQALIIIVAAISALATGFAQTNTATLSPESQTLETRNVDSGNSSTLSWNGVVRRSTSPRDICRAVKGHVRYSRDMLKEDEWRDGKDTWTKAAGDCDDYAATVQDLCKEKGFKAETYVFESRAAHASHAVTIGGTDGTMWLSSNGSYEEVKSMSDAREKLALELGWWAPDVDVYLVERSSSSDSDRRDVLTTTKLGPTDGETNKGLETLPGDSGSGVINTVPRTIDEKQRFVDEKRHFIDEKPRFIDEKIARL
ncbi:MAG: hypothetical protein C0404_03830 [Verrucomicrobia bacterium]|nr:hypothetical protein [Verrucomicrobiota bacterium]